MFFKWTPAEASSTLAAGAMAGAISTNAPDRSDAAPLVIAPAPLEPPTSSLPLPQAERSWTTWGTPTAAVLVVSVGLLAFARRRHARKQRDEGSVTVIGWKGWKYPHTAQARAEFFGADTPALPEAWSIDRVQVDSWINVGTGLMKPATDGRYGLLKPVRPPVVDLALDEDAFLHWIAVDGTSSPIEPMREEPVTGEVVAAAIAEATEETPLRTITEAASQGAHYDHSSPPAEATAMLGEGRPQHEPALPSTPDTVPPARTPGAPRVSLTKAALVATEEATHTEASRREAEQRRAMAQEAARVADEREATQRQAEYAAEQRLADEREAARVAAERKEAERREATRVAAERREAEAREALRIAAERQEAEQREAERVAAERRASEQREVAARAESTRAEAVADAKKLLTAGFPAKALKALEPALQGQQGSGEAWTVAGWCSWRTARDDGPDAVDAVVQAIRAFHQAMTMEPDRVAMLGSALTRCHLFLAQHQQGEARAASLDAALRLMDDDAAKRHAGDSKFALERASALQERALLAPPAERTRLLEQAQQLLAKLPAQDVDDNVRLQQASLYATQAEGTQGRQAEALLARAADLLTHAMHTATGEQRDPWLARLLDVELLRLRPLKAAARLMRLRQLRDAYAQPLAETRSILPLLSWVQILRAWADMLSDAPARDKLAEAESMFDRIESLSPEDIGAVHFARAYYLRLLSGHESTGAALDTLAKAEQLLARTRSPSLSTDVVSLERAEVALARAALLDGREQRDALEQAIRFADASVAAQDGNLPRALTCSINARLRKFDRQTLSEQDKRQLSTLAERLLSVTPHDPEALRLAARAEQVAGDNAATVRLCESAWDAGCRDAALLRLWRDALGHSPVSANADNDPQWKRLNQCVRIAQSTGTAIR